MSGQVGRELIIDLKPSPPSTSAWTTAQIEVLILPAGKDAGGDAPPRDLRRIVSLQMSDPQLRERAAASFDAGEAASRLRLAAEGETADFLVQEEGDTLLLRTGRNDVVAVVPVAELASMAAQLIHAARYQDLLELDLRLAPSSLTGDVALTVGQAGPATKGGRRLAPLPTFGTTEYATAGTTIVATVRNDADVPLFWALLALAPDYSVSLLGEPGILKPGDEMERSLVVTLPAGFVQGTTHLLLVAGTREIDFGLLAMPPITAQGNAIRGRGAVDATGSVFDQALALAGAAQQESATTRPEETWTAVRHSLLVVEGLELPIRAFDAQLVEFPAFGVTLELAAAGPASFPSAVRMLTLEQTLIWNGEYGIAAPFTPPGLAGAKGDLPSVFSLPMHDGGWRNQAPGIDLQLPPPWRNEVSADAPLRIRLAPAMQRQVTTDHAGAFIVAYDGQIYVPAGRWEGDQNAFVLTRLPYSEKYEEWLRLQAYVVDAPPEPAPGLYAVHFEPYTTTSPSPGRDRQLLTEGMLRYVPATAEPLRPGARLALAVHGYGDNGVELAHWLTVQAPQHGLSYDQVLVYRYDSVEQPLEESAGELAKRLARAGIQPGDDLQVDLVAHGTGGLVARWLVEVDGGGRYIDRCLLAGTPSGGSALAGQGQLAFQRMALELNLPHAWSPTLLPRWAHGQPVEDSRHAQELAPGSPFLRRLMAQASTPAIPYLVLAGDGSGTDRFEPLRRGLAAQARGRTPAPEDMMYGDGMSSLASIQAITERRGGATTRVAMVDASYFDYFTAPKSEAALVDWLLREGRTAA